MVVVYSTIVALRNGCGNVAPEPVNVTEADCVGDAVGEVESVGVELAEGLGEAAGLPRYVYAKIPPIIITIATIAAAT